MEAIHGVCWGLNSVAGRLMKENLGIAFNRESLAHPLPPA